MPPAGRGTAQVAQQLRQADPELASLVSVTAIPIEELQQHLLPEELVLQYYVFGAKLYGVTVSSNDVRVAEIASPGLEADVRRFRALIEQGSDQVLVEARALYDRLIRPVEAQIRGKSLLVVPHGVLHYLPFAALHDGSNYLLDSHALRYLPSASVLKFLKPPRTPGLAAVLVLGNPDLGEARLDLPHAETEARGIAGMGSGNTLLLRKEATEEAFKRLAPGFRYIHVASHGEFNASDALQSRLMLVKSDSDDGSLSPQFVFQFDRRAPRISLDQRV